MTIKFTKTPPKVCKSIKVMAKLCDWGLVERHPSMYFLKTKRLTDLAEVLHVTLLFEYVRGSFGPIDKPDVKREFIEGLWIELNNHGLFGSGCVRDHYVGKEVAFWRDYVQ
jgi:hypothetical protein